MNRDNIENIKMTDSITLILSKAEFSAIMSMLDDNATLVGVADLDFCKRTIRNIKKTNKMLKRNNILINRIKMKTAEEILDKRLNYQQNKNCYYYEVYSEILQAMEEYRLNHQVPSTEITKKELSVIECMKDDIRAMIGNSDTDETWLKNVEIIENMLIRVKPKIK